MDRDPVAQPATRVVLRPLATPLPRGFLALALATTVFSAVQLGWVPPDQGRVAALTALAATVPLQLTAAVVGFLARDPVAATGMGVLTGTWAVVGLTTLTSPPGTVSPGLGVLLVVAGPAMLVPAAAAVGGKFVPAAVMGLAAARFAVTGVYELTGSAAWKTAAGWAGIALALLALAAALALEPPWPWSSRAPTSAPCSRSAAAAPAGWRWTATGRWTHGTWARRQVSDHSCEYPAGPPRAGQRASGPSTSGYIAPTARPRARTHPAARAAATAANGRGRPGPRSSSVRRKAGAIQRR